MKNTQAYVKSNVVDAYFCERSRRISYLEDNTPKRSYTHVSSWSDTHFGLSAREIEMMLEWN